MAILRVLPGMTVLAPCDSAELRMLLRAALDQDGPVYMRIGKKGEPAIHTDAAPQINIGHATRVREGNDVCLLAAGTIMSEVVRAAEILAVQNISARIESFHTIKPLDTNCLKMSFSDFPLVAVFEEHSQLGGLAGSISEWRAQQRGKLADMIGFGVPDEFMHEVGSQAYARRKFSLDAESIAARLTAELRG
jgi:transketolase